MELSKGWEMQGYFPNLDPDPDSDWSWAINNFVMFIYPHPSTFPQTTSSFIHPPTHLTGILLINLDIIYLDLEQE